MASEEKKEEIKKIQDQNLFLARGAESQQAETDQFKCGKCKSRKCKYYQMQTRSADEVSFIFKYLYIIIILLLLLMLMKYLI